MILKHLLNKISFFSIIFFCLCFFTPVWAQPFVVHQINTQDKVVALTFDDGPNDRYTTKFLKILEKEKIKATFFLVGKKINKSPGVAKKIKLAGHEIGNHSYAHLDYTKLPPTKIEDDITKSQIVFYKKLGILPLIFRPPYGRLRKRDHTTVSKYFLKVVNWSLDTRDWEPTTTNGIVKDRILTYLKPGSIIICHDNNKHSLETLPDIIREVKKRGYRFVTITELLLL